MTREHSRPIDHDEVRALLPAFIADELNAKERQEVVVHLQQCTKCYADFTEMRTLMTAFAAWPGYPVPIAKPSLADAVLARIAEEYPNTPARPAWDNRPEQSRTPGSTRIRSPHARDKLEEWPEGREKRLQSVPPLQAGRSRRGGVVAAIVAIASVAALFAVLLHTFAAGMSVSYKGPTPTVAPTGTAGTLRYLGANSVWQIGSDVQVSGAVDNTLVVAPSDPQVMYRWAGDNLRSGQRSGDGGRTWADLTVPVPQGAPGSPFIRLALSVSPFDAKTVVAMLSTGYTTHTCPNQTGTMAPSESAKLQVEASRQPVPQRLDSHIDATAPPPPGHVCYANFTSADGGGTWREAQLPGQGGLAATRPGSALIGQGNRLFATLNGPNDEVRLGHRLASSEDGVHWQYADAAIAAQGQAIVEFVATPGGATLFATTAPTDADRTAANVAATRMFWRSNNQGATWRALGSFPTGVLRFFNGTLAGAVTVGGATYIYETDWSSAPLLQLGAIPTVHVTADDGHTWQVVPTAGQPTGQVIPGLTVGVLPDGTFVAPFAQYTRATSSTTSDHFTQLAYYGWKPGADAWTQLTPVIPEVTTYFQVAWLIQPGATTPAGLWTEVGDNNSVKLAYCRLTA